MKKVQKFPEGWDASRVARVLSHYELQGDEQALAEDEASLEDSSQTVIEVPRELVPEIRRLIAKHKLP